MKKKYLDLKVILLIVLSVFFGLCIYKLNQDQVQFRYLEIVSSQQSAQLNILREENYQLLHPTVSPELQISLSETRKLKTPSLYSFTLNCPEIGICEFTTDNGYSSVTFGDKLTISFNMLDAKKINNPNYSSALKWYDALTHRDPRATGSNLDPFYGTKPVNGTDGLIYPFYRGYDIGSVSAFIFGVNPGVIVKSYTQDETDFLIPHGMYIYRFSIGNMSEASIQQMKGILSTIVFL